MTLAMLGLSAVLGLSKPVDVAALPAPTPSQGISADAALDADVARLGIKTGAARYFAIGAGVPWQAVVKRLDAELRRQNAARTPLPGADPGRQLIEGWRTKKGDGVIVAMRRNADGKGGVVGYYPARFG